MRTFLKGTSDDRLSGLWVLMAGTGLRRGEAIGLRWDAVDLDKNQLHVSRTLITVGSEIVWSTPKTSRGRRSVALDSSTVSALRRHRARQAQERLSFGSNYNESSLVFAREDGSPLHPKSVSDEFQRRAKQVGVPVIRLHDLRHSYASLALQAGVQTKIVSERLGHVSTSITSDIYQHVTPGMQADAAEAIGRLLFDGAS